MSGSIQHEPTISTLSSNLNNPLVVSLIKYDTSCQVNKWGIVRLQFSVTELVHNMVIGLYKMIHFQWFLKRELIWYKYQSTIRPSIDICKIVKSPQICSWNQPVLSSDGKVSCLRKQQCLYQLNMKFTEKHDTNVQCLKLLCLKKYWSWKWLLSSHYS